MTLVAVLPAFVLPAFEGAVAAEASAGPTVAVVPAAGTAEASCVTEVVAGIDPIAVVEPGRTMRGTAGAEAIACGTNLTLVGLN